MKLNRSRYHPGGLVPVVLILICTACPVAGQQPLTLDQALSQVRQNPLYQSQIHQVAAFQGRLKQARMRPNPAFEFLYGSEAIGGEAKNFELGLGISNQWERGGKRRLRGQIAELELERMTLDAENRLRLLTVQARQAYLELQHIQQQLALLEKHRERMEGLSQIDQIRVDSGEIPSLNAKFLETDLIMLSTDQSHLDNQKWEALSRLNLAMGAPPEREYALPPWDPTPGAIPPAEHLVAFAWEHRPDLKMLEVALKQADLEIQMEQAAAKRDWRWSVEYLYGRDGLEEDDFFPKGVIDFTRSTDHSLEAKLSIPLSLSDDNSGNIAAAVSMKQVRESQLAHARALVRGEILSAVQAFQHSLLDQSIYGKDLLPQLDDKRQRLESAYLMAETSVGASTLIGVQRDSLSISFEALDADFRAWRSVIELEAASGGTLNVIGSNGQAAPQVPSPDSGNIVPPDGPQERVE